MSPILNKTCEELIKVGADWEEVKSAVLWFFRDVSDLQNEWLGRKPKKELHFGEMGFAPSGPFSPAVFWAAQESHCDLVVTPEQLIAGPQKFFEEWRDALIRNQAKTQEREEQRARERELERQKDLTNLFNLARLYPKEIDRFFEQRKKTVE